MTRDLKSVLRSKAKKKCFYFVKQEVLLLSLLPGLVIALGAACRNLLSDGLALIWLKGLRTKSTISGTRSSSFSDNVDEDPEESVDSSLDDDSSAVAEIDVDWVKFCRLLGDERCEEFFIGDDCEFLAMFSVAW